MKVNKTCSTCMFWNNEFFTDDCGICSCSSSTKCLYGELSRFTTDNKIETWWKFGCSDFKFASNKDILLRLNELDKYKYEEVLDNHCILCDYWEYIGKNWNYCPKFSSYIWTASFTSEHKLIKNTFSCRDWRPSNRTEDILNVFNIKV